MIKYCSDNGTLYNEIKISFDFLLAIKPKYNINDSFNYEYILVYV